MEGWLQEVSWAGNLFEPMPRTPCSFFITQLDALFCREPLLPPSSYTPASRWWLRVRLSLSTNRKRQGSERATCLLRALFAARLISLGPATHFVWRHRHPHFPAEETEGQGKIRPLVRGPASPWEPVHTPCHLERHPLAQPLAGPCHCC